MKTRMILSLGLSALVLGGTTVGCTGGGIASASDRSAAAADKASLAAARGAAKALVRGDGVTAVGYAENAVTLAPRQAGYRMLLGQSYLKAGRFASARQAFADTLALSGEGDATRGKAALNLALATIAVGDWQGARAVLADEAGSIPAADRGLALALAGDTAGAVALLTQVARSADASPKVRQNLALSLALAGQWQAARVVAAADMSPADVDRRLQDWAAFAQPDGASDQVASLLGVRAVSDRGQPVALALSAPAPMAQTAAAQVESSPLAAAPPAQPTMVMAAAEPLPTIAAAPSATATRPAIVFAARREVVQPLPAVLLRAPAGPAKVALNTRSAWLGAKRIVRMVPDAAPRAVPRAPAGQWFVQVGAFESAGIARDAWGRVGRRTALFAGRTPNGATIRTKAGAFYRLSIGGFARADADAACSRYRSEGGVCFVRRAAGDQVAQWTRSGTQLASR